jgi:hypothetical protein
MADAMEAAGQHVHEKAPDELVRVEPHRLPARRAVDAIILTWGATGQGFNSFVHGTARWSFQLRKLGLDVSVSASAG